MNFYPRYIRPFVAGQDLSNHQFKFVRLDSQGRVVLCNSNTDVPIGVLQDKPLEGQVGEVLIVGRTQVVTGGALSVGAFVGTDNQGRAVALTPGTDTTRYVVGRVIQGATGANLIADVEIDCVAPHRAS